MLQKMWKLETTKAIIQKWQSVYTGISVISNQITLAHQDFKGQPEWYNTLASNSEGGSIPWLLINDLGLNLLYLSRTVVSLCGSLLTHEIRFWVLVIRWVLVS